MGDNKEPILIILIAIILLGLVYSPLKNASNNGVAIGTGSGSSSLGTGNGSDYSANEGAAEGVRNVEQEVKQLQKNVNEEGAKSKRSPYYDKITISGVFGLSDPNPDREYISLFTNLQQNETVKITGWYLKSETTGYYVMIGKAALLPFPFTKTESDIILNQGDRAYLVKGFSPIGISFRTNKCTGFFEENRSFSPSLSLQCPRPIEEKLPNFSSVYDRNDECLDLIENISRCTTINGQFVRDLPDTVSQSCKTYVTTQINYNTCVANHFSDINFPGDEYRVYLGKFGPLWRDKRETINLHDQNGLIVDTISY